MKFITGVFFIIFSLSNDISITNIGIGLSQLITTAAQAKLAAPFIGAVLLQCPARKPRKEINHEQGAKLGGIKQHLIVNIRVNPSFHVDRLERFIMLDEIYDVKTRSKAKILSPYLIEISRGEPVFLYPLEYTEGEAFRPIEKNYSHTSSANGEHGHKNCTTKTVASSTDIKSEYEDSKKDTKSTILHLQSGKSSLLEHTNLAETNRKLGNDKLLPEADTNWDSTKNLYENIIEMNRQFDLRRRSRDKFEPQMVVVSEPPVRKLYDAFAGEADNSKYKHRTSLAQFLNLNRCRKSNKRMKRFSEHHRRALRKARKIDRNLGIQEKSKRKRSSISHDLLLLQYLLEHTKKATKRKARPIGRRNIDEDIKSCNSCGKHKKPQGKTDSSNVLSRECGVCSECECAPVGNIACMCAAHKRARSAVTVKRNSVLNTSVPLPFLMTQLRVFRKRRNTWYKITPLITLSSLSQTFANANFSALFSSHVDIIQLEKSLHPQYNQVFVPKNESIMNSGNLVEQLEDSLSDNDCVGNGQKSVISKPQTDAAILQAHSITISALPNADPTQVKRKLDGRSVTNDKRPVRSKLDQNSFPSSLDVMANKVPAYSIKINMPFEENDIIYMNYFNVKIARVITDATTKNVLQISIDVINESAADKKFFISVSHCGVPYAAAKSNIEKLLMPFIGESVTFLLPLVTDTNQKHTKFHCDVLVKVKQTANNMESSMKSKSKKTEYKLKPKRASDENIATISSRTVLVETENRCFCIWECTCHCMGKLETHVNMNICKEMAYREEEKAGVLSNNLAKKKLLDKSSNADDNSTSILQKFPQANSLMINACYLWLVMILLGLLKAVIGRICSSAVDRCGYDYVQPGKPYDDSSRCRHFIINLVFFLIFPFCFCCKCFTRSSLNRRVASTEWQCANDIDDKSRNEVIRLCTPTNSEDTLFQVDNSRLPAGASSIASKNYLHYVSSAMQDSFLDGDGYNETDDEDNTIYILKTLVENRESLKKMSQTYNRLRVLDETDPKMQEAAEMIKALSNAKIVYRTFEHPVGNVQQIPYGITYCVQGYFLPSADGKYEFVNYDPMMQYYGVSVDGSNIEILRKPILLFARDFSRIYNNPSDVLSAKDLFINPPASVPCINVHSAEYAALTFAKQQHRYLQHLESS